MKRKLTILLSLVLSFTLLSCTNESLSEFGNSENNITKSDTSAQNIDRVIIVPLEVDIDTLPPMAATMSSNSDYVLSSNLRALKDHPLFLKSVSTGRYMRSTGTGVETILDYKNDWDSYKYVIRTFASSTGIPYMIYSKQTGTALTVGTNPNDPNAKVVYAREGDPSTGFEMSVWDIFPATNSQGVTKDNGAVVIESKFYLGNGPGGGPYGDVFNYVINAASNSQLRYARYANQTSQEFLIEPTGNFTLESIKYVNAYSAKVTPTKLESITMGEINESFSNKAFQFKFSTLANETSYFAEDKGINFILSNQNTKKFRRPNVINGQIDLIPNVSSEEDLFYNSNTQQIRRNIGKTLPVTIQPRTKLNVTYHFQYYRVEVDYEATISLNGKVCKLAGRWNGEVCVDDNLEADFEAINLDTREARSFKMNVSEVTTANRLTL